MAVDLIFRQAVYQLVASIPSGRVMTYGQIAALCGHPGAARAVGMIAHFGDPDLPWQRVVNAQGGMARGFVPDGIESQARLLAEEGVEIKKYKLDLNKYIWWPNE